MILYAEKKGEGGGRESAREDGADSTESLLTIGKQQVYR